MPVVAGWIDEMRSVFGADCINQSIRRGMKGETTFHAIENGHEIGTRDTAQYRVIGGDDLILVREAAPAGRGRK
jgi:hypothetical protein